MIETTLATIVDIRRDAGNTLILQFADRPACRRCAEGRGCGAGLFGRGRAGETLTIQVEPGSTYRVGDQVSVRLRRGQVLRAASLAYGLPLAGAASGALVTSLVYGGDAATAFGSLAGLLFGAVVARFSGRPSGAVEDACRLAVSPASTPMAGR